MKKFEDPKIRSMVFIALMAAIICIAAPFSIPMLGLVPVSLATFAVYLAGGLLGAKAGTAAVCVYIILGAIGLPVFSGFSGGLAKLLGVTGGYIVGYIPCAFLTGAFAEKNKPFAAPIGMALGTLACYAFGTAWYMFFTKSELVPALMGCVIPFLIGDAVKIAAASAVTVPLRGKLKSIVSGRNHEK